MKTRNYLVVSLLALVSGLGCASTQITDRDQTVTGNLPRPHQIWVYDFAASPAELPKESALAGQPVDHPTPQTPEQVDTGRKLGAEIAAHLVAEIRAMGMPAERGSADTKPAVNDIVIRGYLLSVHEGSEAKRIGIGLGAGASELKTAVEGFQMTPQGLRKVGSGDVDASGNKTPGMAVGLATLVATHNPLGLIVSTGMKVYDDKTGKDKIGGRADQTAKEIGEQLKKKFAEEGWI